VARTAGLVDSVKDAGLAALVALGVGAPLLGLKTEAADRGLTLVPRPGLLLAAVAAVFAGRLLFGLFLASRQAAAARAADAPPRIGPSPYARIGRMVAPVLLTLSVLLPFIPGVGRYEIDLGTLVLTYIMLGWGLNIVVGLAGLLDLGYVAFYAATRCSPNSSTSPSGRRCR
jgi:branched-chain amino acid transport system permease protein